MVISLINALCLDTQSVLSNDIFNFLSDSDQFFNVGLFLRVESKSIDVCCFYLFFSPLSGITHS